MKDYFNAFSHSINIKMSRAAFKIAAALGIIIISLSPTTGVWACTEPASKYYLPTCCSASEANWAETAPAVPAAKTAPAVGVLNLEAPARVAAGEAFVLALNTGENFPLLVNEDAAFFESLNNEKPKLAGIRTLDTKGTARLQLQRTKTGVYRYNVLAGPYQSEISVTVQPAQPAAVREAQKQLFMQAGSRAETEFIVEDTYGNKIVADSTAEKPAEELLAVKITVPVDNAGKILPSEVEYRVTANPAGNFVVSFKAENIGDYLVEASLLHYPGGNDGHTAHTLVCARGLGAVTGLELAVQDEDKPFLRLGKNAAQPSRLKVAVILRGENNFTKTPSLAEERNLIFSTDRPDLLRIEKTAGSKALLTDKGKSGLATFTASYVGEGKGLQKSIPILIAGDPAQIKPEIKINNLTALIEATLLDKEGKPTWEKTKSYRINTPTGIKVTEQNDFTCGKAEFTLEAKDYGTYHLDITTEEGLAHNLKIDFPKIIKPARHAVIFIGQESYIKDGQPAKMNAAPEMSYGRIFVPVEFLTDAFGVAVNAFPEIETVALQSQDGIKIIIDRAALQLTVTNAKDESTLTTPVGTLFLHKKADTYFVPAGIIARILGLEVDYLPKRDQIEHVTFIQN